LKAVSAGKTEKFSYAFKLSDERLKLFLDISANGFASGSETSLDPGSNNSKLVPTANENPAVEAGVNSVANFSPISVEDVLSVFPKQVWEGCIHQEVLQQLVKELNRGIVVKERRVAKGISPENGVDGRFVMTVKKMSPNPELHEDQRGYVDFRELHRFENVQAGTVVAKIFPPTNGKDGTDPFGNSIPAKNGQAAKLVFDQTIVSKPHPEGGGEDLVAAVDGFLAEEGGKLSVQGELKISGNIDFQVGSIDFVGSVVVQGEVMPGFIVRGRKGVLIRGSVQEASIFSSEGSVKIMGHCMGSLATKIEAKNEVVLSVANQLEARAGFNVQIEKEARGCLLRSAGTIMANHAALIGGSLNSACGLEAREIGARSGSITQISLASDVAMSKDYVQNEHLIAEHEKVLTLLHAHLGPLAKTEAGLKLMPERQRQKLEPLVQKKRAVESSLAELRLRKDELLKSAKVNHQFKVNFIEKLNPGVVVVVGEDKFECREVVSGPQSLVYDVENRAFNFCELSALECSVLEHNDVEAIKKRKDR
jgi:uncharacterized protein (DUF342 family)